jgi:hypothetical protein
MLVKKIGPELGGYPMNNEQLRARGATLLELCISITLTGVIATASTIAFQRSAHWFRTLKDRLTAERTIIESFARLERAFMAVDSARSNGLWKIHPGGRFSFANGSEHPISRIKGTSQPRPGSDGLSILEVNPSGALVITFDSEKGTAFCPLYSNRWKIDGIRSFIKRSIHGDTQYSYGNELHGAVWPRSCGSLSGSPIQSVTIKRPQREIAGQIILPVVQEYSLFVDRSSHLRLISHRGGWIRENQPLINGIQTLHISSSLSTGGVLMFIVKIRTVSGIEKQWSRVSTLTRSEGYNDLLL